MNKNAFTLLEIMMVVAIIGLLAVIAIPSFTKSRDVAQQNACVNNLRQIDYGKEQAALAYKWITGVDCDAGSNKAIVNAYIKGQVTPECPCGGVYSYQVISTNPTCTIDLPRSHRLPTN